MAIETDVWPIIPAKYQTKVNGVREVRLIVMHAMETPERLGTARAVGAYFSRGEKQASAHIGVDDAEIIRYVDDNNVAWAAPGVNHDGIHIELAGLSKQSTKDWGDPYSTRVLKFAARAAAQFCRKYGIPARHLSNMELTTAEKGIIGHYQATQCYKPNQGHTDPGKGFPWDSFIEAVAKNIVDFGTPQGK